MGFLDGLNGGTKKPAASGSSPFLSGVRQRTDRERQVAGLQVEAERAKAESDRQNSPVELAKQTVLGVPKVLQDVGKALVDEPMKTLATPVIRTEQVIATGIGRATGNRALEEAANRPMPLPSAFSGEPTVIEPQRAFGDEAIKQIAGEALKYGATIYTGGRVAPVVGTARQGLIRAAGVQGAKEGAIATGGYMGGDEMARRESTAGSIAAETAKGVGLGGFLGGIVGAGGAALARPFRTVKLPVQDANPETVYHGTSADFDRIKGNQDGVTYVASDPAEARLFAEDPILGRDGARPRVIQLSASKGKSKDVTDEVTSYIFEEDPNIDYSAMTIDDVVRQEAERAREQGYRYITFEHPSSVNDGTFTAKVSLYPEEDLANAVPNIRRIKPLEVQDANIEPGRTRANARQVPINRVPEPYVPDAELPVIKAGRTPRTAGVDIEDIGAPDVYAPEPRPEAARAPKAVPAPKPKKMLYHATDVEFDQFDPSMNPEDYGTWFTPSRAEAEEAGMPIIMERELKPGVRLITEKGLARREKTRAWLDANDPFYEILEREGYKGIQYDNGTVQLFDPEADTVAVNRGSTDIGVTSFRGKPVSTVAETLPYYQTSRAKGFENTLKTSFRKYLLPNPKVEKTAGWWEGSIEPSFMVRVNMELNDSVRAYAVEAAKKANQDAVILFSKGEGKSVKYTFSGKKPEEVLAALKKNGVSGATVQGDKVLVYDLDGSLKKSVASASRELKTLPANEKGHGELIFKDDYAKYLGDGDSVRPADGPAAQTKPNRSVAYDPELRVVPEPAQAPQNPARTRPDSSVANTSARGPAPKPRAEKGAARADITPPGRPVTMDIPRRTASVPVREPKAGEAVTKAKAASDVNKKLAALGFDELDEETLPGIRSISKEDQVAKVARLLEDPESARAMAMGSKPVPDGVAPQVLFNAVKNKAVQEADGETLSMLVRSKITTERSQAAQTLGSAGFNNDAADVLGAMRDIERFRSDAASRRRLPSDVKKEAKTADMFIKKASAKETWDSVIDGLTC